MNPITLCLFFLALSSSFTYGKDIFYYKDIGAGCYQTDFEKVKVLEPYLVKNDCLIHIKCSPSFYVGLNYRCNPNKYIYFSSVEEFGSGVVSVALAGRDMFYTVYNRSAKDGSFQSQVLRVNADKASKIIETQPLKKKIADKVMETDKGYYYFFKNKEVVKLYILKPTPCSNKSLTRRFWKGCYSMEEIKDFKFSM